MKSNLMRLVRWFCRQLTLNELHSVVPILLEVLAESRNDISLKPDERPPHFREFRVDTVSPLLRPPEPDQPEVPDWRELLKEYERGNGKALRPVLRRNGAKEPPPGCICEHCGAPRKFLYLNNGKADSQVRCKVCGKTCPTHRTRRQSKAKYYCPHCSYALFLWKETELFNAYKCPNYTCRHYLNNLARLTDEEVALRDEGKTSQFKLHYQYREFHLNPNELKCSRPATETKVNLHRIHNGYHVVALTLSLSINLGLSARLTKKALKGLYNINLSHQSVINYVNASAAYLSDFVDRNSPRPAGIAAADETYIIVDGNWHYTWFIIDAEEKAICGYNLSTNRGPVPALSLLYDTYGKPEETENVQELITDGNPSYDCAIMAYNEKTNALQKRTVIGLQNLDPESTEYRRFKQLVERLNRTYKYHTRPRAGFKSFDGAVALTTLFVAYYNFMREHSGLKRVPVPLECLKDCELMPEMWIKLLQQAA